MWTPHWILQHELLFGVLTNLPKASLGDLWKMKESVSDMSTQEENVNEKLYLIQIKLVMENLCYAMKFLAYSLKDTL